MFKVAKVSSEIKKSSTIFWYRTNGIDYVCNGYWIIKTDLKKKENRKILCSLVEKFGLIPSESKKGKEVIITTSYKKVEISESTKKPKWLELLENRETEEIENTRLIHMSDRDNHRIFKGKEYIYINSRFIEMIDEKASGIKFEGSRDLEPIIITCKNDEMLILPVRMESKSEYLKN
ncbi:hypothetical protein KQI42_19960 [Tissierella sp. MSJ-40]|uniref:Uncharacterized protein n=1 Tax=Tissierella simiarum TaxID=2841534 RepID=A0ABS6EDN9_9FIRM|nr:hypothetical protein [Tissierella simiarum]MBU5440273.1 hypothetical protein [Tissierella simiarum]